MNEIVACAFLFVDHIHAHNLADTVCIKQKGPICKGLFLGSNLKYAYR